MIEPSWEVKITRTDGSIVYSMPIYDKAKADDLFAKRCQDAPEYEVCLVTMWSDGVLTTEEHVLSRRPGVLHMAGDRTGLYGKYTVYRNDTGQEVNGFVLCPEKDLIAREAMLVYAGRVEHSLPLLAEGLRIWVKQVSGV